MILFADDLSLLAPTRSALQRLIDLCHQYCSSIGLNFNSLKSKILVFSKSRIIFDDLKTVTLGGDNIDYTDSVKYLGVSIFSKNGLCYSSANDLRTFYRATNSLLSVLSKPSEEVLMYLLYTNCVPIITYAFNVKDLLDSITAVNCHQALVY